MLICENLRFKKNSQTQKLTNSKNLKAMEKKNIWGIVIQTLITILTAIGTTLGVTSCI